MLIRKAIKSDAPWIQLLMDELNLYRSQIFSKENQGLHDRINPYSPLKDKDIDENIFFVVVTDTGEIGGFVQWSTHERKNHRLSKLGYVDELFVRADLRGKWMAGKLFQELENELKARGCDHLTTHTDFENELSQKFYTDAGMSRVTVEFWKKLS